MYGAPDYEVAAEAGQEYRERRASLAATAHGWTPADPFPEVEYTPQERAVWSTVCRRLYTAHAHHACSDYLHGWEALALPTARIPRVAEVNARLAAAGGFRLVPSAGWLGYPAYFGALADGRFPTTLHLRHPDTGGHDPDLVHSLLGHAVLLAVPRFARLHRTIGEAGLRTRTPAAHAVLARLFWFTCEVGVLQEGGRLVCSGAQLLSSPDAMDAFRGADVRPLDLPAMGRGDGAGSVLYRAGSADELEWVVMEFLAAFDDDTPARLATARAGV